MSSRRDSLHPIVDLAVARYEITVVSVDGELHTLSIAADTLTPVEGAPAIDIAAKLVASMLNDSWAIRAIWPVVAD